EEHSAGAALTLIAAFLRAGEVEVLAQHVEEGGARIKRKRVTCAIDSQAHRDWRRCRVCPRLRSGAGCDAHRNGNCRPAGNELAPCRLAGVAGNIIGSVSGHVELLRPWCQLAMPRSFPTPNAACGGTLPGLYQIAPSWPGIAHQGVDARLRRAMDALY